MIQNRIGIVNPRFGLIEEFLELKTLPVKTVLAP